MPRYSYKCSNCEEVLDVFHSISERLDVCDCGSEGTLTKMVSRPSFATSNKKDSKPPKIGSVVESSIEEFRSDLKQQKENLLKDAEPND